MRVPATRGWRSSPAPDVPSLAAAGLAAERVGEAARYASAAEAFALPERDDDQFAGVAVMATDEDQIAVEEIVHVENASLAAGARIVRRGLGAPSVRPGFAYPGGYLRSRVERAAAAGDALAESFGGVVADGDQNSRRWSAGLGLGQALW
jgi:hypothetical protein